MGQVTGGYHNVITVITVATGVAAEFEESSEEGLVGRSRKEGLGARGFHTFYCPVMANFLYQLG